jgi:hypothetical protein
MARAIARGVWIAGACGLVATIGAVVVRMNYFGKERTPTSASIPPLQAPAPPSFSVAKAEAAMSAEERKVHDLWKDQATRDLFAVGWYATKLQDHPPEAEAMTMLREAVEATVLAAPGPGASNEEPDQTGPTFAIACLCKLYRRWGLALGDTAQYEAAVVRASASNDDVLRLQCATFLGEVSRLGTLSSGARAVYEKLMADPWVSSQVQRQEAEVLSKVKPHG